ncbi:MAG: pilus assembly PilX N-terminal domain-containing protein [Deltaproteobacteria bacterium]
MTRQSNRKSILGNEKGMVLAVTLMLIAILVLLGTTAVMTVTTDLKIAGNYRQSQVALYNAEAGVAQVIDYLRTTTSPPNYPTTSGSPVPITISCPTGYNFDTSVVLNYVAPGKYKFQMTGTGANNASKTIEVTFTKSNIPGVDGAVAMYGENPGFLNKGSAKTRGTDWKVPADAGCDGVACAGVTPGSGGAVPGVYTKETAPLAQVDNQNGEIVGVPDWKQGGGTSTQQTWVNFVASVAFLDANTSTIELGTRAAPKVNVVPAGTSGSFGSNDNGFGIMIVRGALTFNGTACFEGLIILDGIGASVSTGNGKLFGSLITINHTDLDLTAQGNCELNYSSEALNNLNNIAGLPQGIRRISLTSWKEI